MSTGRTSLKVAVHRIRRQLMAALLAAPLLAVAPTVCAQGPSYEEFAVRIAILARDARYGEA